MTQAEKLKQILIFHKQGNMMKLKSLMHILGIVKRIRFSGIISLQLHLNLLRFEEDFTTPFKPEFKMAGR